MKHAVADTRVKNAVINALMDAYEESQQQGATATSASE